MVTHPGKKVCRWFLFFLLIAATGGCFNISLIGEPETALKEQKLEGQGADKVLVIPINGVLSIDPDNGLIQKAPGMIHRITAQLRKAASDRRIKALLLKIDSPGGSVTASDLLYHEITRFKEKTGAVIVVSMMGMAASGGYYISLPADFIMAHPTTVTGSIGVIFIRPRIDGLMEKVGVSVDVHKSGIHKDMGSPFRNPTETEIQQFQNLVETLNRRFIELIEKHRTIDTGARSKILKAGVFLADQAKAVGLIDGVGYLDDALEKAKALSNLKDNARVIIYRDTGYSNDTIYQLSSGDRNSGNQPFSSISPGLLNLSAGFYYLWPPLL